MIIKLEEQSPAGIMLERLAALENMTAGEILTNLVKKEASARKCDNLDKTLFEQVTPGDNKNNVLMMCLLMLANDPEAKAPEAVKVIRAAKYTAEKESGHGKAMAEQWRHNFIDEAARMLGPAVLDKWPELQEKK